ncbi:MAG: type II CAAX prenyl endopeptidase Rce1 family protein [Candidatus Hodarchaeota archaeon]
MSKQGVRFPYRLDLTDHEDLSYILLLPLMSIVFGFVHIWGYGINKLIPTILMGFLLGGLFLRYGASSCILYHMLHNWILVIGAFFFSRIPNHYSLRNHSIHDSNLGFVL